MGKVQERQKKVREKVLIGLRRGWSLSGAARYAEISRRQLLKWRDEDPIFAAEMRDAQEEGVEGLEDIAMSRARRKSDVLLMFMLNGAAPEKYKRKVEAPPPQNIEVTIKKF